MFKLTVDSEIELRLPNEHYAKEAFDVIMKNYAHLEEWSPWVNEKISVESTREFYKKSFEAFSDEGVEISLLIFYQGKVVGSTGFHEINRRNKSAEIGYWLAKEVNGKGIVTKCVERQLDYAFDEMKLNRVTIKCVPENLKSRKIPVKLGFTQEGIERESGWLHTRFADHVVYSMLASEWRNLSQKKA